MNPPSDVIRVPIVGDHALYRRGLQTVLSTEEGIEVVGEAADGVEAVERAEETMPDIVVMDVGMPKRGGIDACRVIKQRVPSARILVLTNSDDDTDLFEAVRAGANGYLLKDATEEIASGIRGVYHGQSMVSPIMATNLLREFNQLSKRVAVPAATPEFELPRLTNRELEILERIAKGRLNREIAEDLVISENTVRNHVRNILDKLQMHSRMQAAMYAVRHRLIDPSE